MIAYGKAPFLECSSKGDKRFSAFYARIKGRGNKSIEEIYQAFKVFEDGKTGLSWKDAKGKTPVNLAEARILYSQLWQEYIRENPDLLATLLNANGLSDMFGQPGSVCQATELWEIRKQNLLKKIGELCKGSIRVANKKDYIKDSLEVVFEVDRTGPLGNQFVLSNKNDRRMRDVVISQFEKVMRSTHANPRAIDEIGKIADEVMAGKDVVLLCWCHPLPCHGQVIQSLVIERILPILDSSLEAQKVEEKPKGQLGLFM